ncbi:SEFIR domain-containing protein [Alcaligenes phenolicus]|uniref:SEFIR domain-containing protein n=1 Tax=Alcaligenes phenolicus TaxID=232846 RepID=A0ABV2BGC9_9BURK
MIAPKLFISYSWSNAEHEQWVINLASELRESGVDVILDKWDLKEGHDAVAFMEKMVTDPDIKKVAIICDEKYAAKADGRAGGVGTETQIISREVYENQAQEKFVAVVCGKDESGKAYLPTYYKSRIYIDLSEADRYADNFERLLRWIFDKPLYVKPELGNKPSFLSEGEHVLLGTTAIFKRCIDAIKNHKAHAAGAFDDYCTAFSENLERFRISKSEGEFDDAVINNIEEFLPFRNEVIQLFIAVAQYAPEEQFIHRMHRFLESMIPYMSRTHGISQWSDWDFDNYKFIVHELFLYALAILLKHDRIEQANYLLQQQYYLPGNSEYGRDTMVSFTVFRENLHSFDHRNQRLGLRRLSLRADLLKNRCTGIGIDFRYLLQADFVAFMRAEVETQDTYNQWWPETLVLLGHFNSPFEIFARSVSKSYFNNSKVLLSIEVPKDLEPLFKSYQDGSRELPRWQFDRFNPAALLGYKDLATRP